MDVVNLSFSPHNIREQGFHMVPASSRRFGQDFTEEKPQKEEPQKASLSILSIRLQQQACEKLSANSRALERDTAAP